MMKRDFTLVWFCCFSISAPVFAQEHQFYPSQITYRQTIPRLEQVVGHGWGEDITSYQEMEQYLKALADSSPRVELVPYGKTWEGRTLSYLILASESNLARLEEIRAGVKKLGDPRTMTEAQAQRLIQWLPVVVCYRAEEVSRGSFETLSTPPSVRGRLHGEEGGVAYVIPWGTNAAARALTRLLREGVRVHSSDKPFTLGTQAFPAGSLIVKGTNNPDDLHRRLTRLAGEVGVEIFATNTSWVEAGVNLGSRQVRFLHKPKIVLAYSSPTRPYSVGWTRYLLEEVYDSPVTIIPTQQLRRADLSKYNVVILPDVSPASTIGYQEILGTAGAQRIKRWVRGGGTLIALGHAVRWLTHEKVGLLATSREFKHSRPNKQSRPETRSGQAKSALARPEPTGVFNLDAAIQPKRELPTAIPGAIMRVRLDTEHWLAHGYDGAANVVVRSGNIFTPLRLDNGRNVGLYLEAEKVLLSGLAWEESREQIAQKAYLMEQPNGRGHVIAFVEDPNFRAFTDGLNLLFLNAVFFGPSH